MRKAVSVLLVFLFLFSCACAESGTSFTAAREEADRIEQAYGVRILIGNECPGESIYFLVASAEAGDDPSPEKTEEALRILDQTLAGWPEGLLSYFGGKLRFCLTGEIVTKDTGEAYAGFTQWENYRYCIYMDVNQIIPTEINHEGWHAAEMKAGLSFRGWEKLNPEGFAYTVQFYTGDPWDPEWFYRPYSIVNPQEDRASVYEAYFLEPPEWWEAHPHLQAKLDMMRQWIPEVFGD